MSECFEPSCGCHTRALESQMTVDRYGNDPDSDRLVYCCFPDCGCDGARLCMAEKGANFCSQQLNIEHKRPPVRVPTFDETFLRQCGIKGDK